MSNLESEDKPVVEGWNVGECLGGGGFATVWKASPADGEADVRAIKVLRPKHRATMSLYNEWDALRRSRHPNVVCAHQGSDDILMMEYIEGPTLADQIRAQKQWTLLETTSILGQLCDALGAVHAANLVHHDVNANNIILADRAVLVDFGCATPAGERYAGTGRNPQWLSPEAVNGQPASVVDDLWPIPLTALAMLTGLSHVGGDPMDVWVMLKCYEGFDVLPDPNIPPGFEKWFAKATHPEPDERFQTASELKAALVRLGM
jgi:serine/threonine-protein kinase